MNKLNKLDKLILELTQDPIIKRFKELEKIIDNDHLLALEYNNLLALQRMMITKRENPNKDYTKAKNNYEKAKNNILKHVIMTEYLDLLEEVNYDLVLIQKIITKEINIDFE